MHEPCGYHHGEDDGGLGGLDDPEQDQAAELDDGEEVDFPQRDVPQVDEVRLVLGWHAEQLQPVKELRAEETLQASIQLLLMMDMRNPSSPECLAATTPPCRGRLRTTPA